MTTPAHKADLAGGELPFGPATRAWLSRAFPAPTRVQREGWPVIASGAHALLLAPTGSGKTLAAFLAALDRLTAATHPPRSGVRVLYVSPLKALAVDVERNLRAPLVGIGREAERLGIPLRPVDVDVRTGDTSARDRHQQARHPGDILVTTPESLFLILTSRARAALETVETVIVDEIHALAGTKRGVHLALSLERLVETCGREVQRVGLSATQRPLTRIAGFLGGTGRDVSIVDTSEPPRIDLRIVVPVDDLDAPGATRAPPAPPPGDDGRRRRPASRRTNVARQSGGRPAGDDGGAPPAPREGGIWPSVYPAILDEIRRHRSTIVFTNSRILCERIAQKVNELAGEELVRTHHGSLSHVRRAEVEDQLKEGRLPAIVATSSLELGIDMGAVDLVILVESPGSASRGLQRIGRASHHVGGTSSGVLFPKFKGDLLEATVVADLMRRGEIEETHTPKNCLDVLAQQIVAMVAVAPRTVDELHALVRRAAPYAELSREVLESVLDMLAGRFPSDELADLSPRVIWDRSTDEITPRRGARSLAVMNGGTIPDRGLFTVHLGPDGPRLGELDEEMTYESRQGDTIILGSSTWRIEEITRDRVIVSPAPGEPGRLPFWRGERTGRPIAVGRAIGRFLRETEGHTVDEIAREAQRIAPLDERAATNLARYLVDQRAATGAVPTDRTIVVERFRDEIGDWRVCVLTPFGSRVHMPWALAIQARLSEESGFHVDVLWSDDGIALRLADSEEIPPAELLFPSPEDVEERVLGEVEKSSLFASAFRENAGRALLLPKRRLHGRTPLWLQRRRSEALLAVARRFPRFPIVLETVRECMKDVFDVPALVEVLSGIARRDIRVVDVETKSASPFARGLVFQYIAAWLYEGDAPLAERRAQALTLDRALLSDLLGQDEMRELLDARALDDVEAELQGLDEPSIAHADRLHDVLRRIGDLALDEIAARATVDAAALVAMLESTRRALAVRIAGRTRYVAVEDAARYRDALGVALPPGLPASLTAPVDDALESLLLRFARTHAPFHEEDVAARFGLTTGVVVALLGALEARGLLLRGELRPGGTRREWCDPEVLKRIKRRSLARLRDDVAPVDAEVYARFLQEWHGVGSARGGVERLLEAVEKLEGTPLPLSDLDRILALRVRDYRPALLDEAGAQGLLVWIGRGATSATDGKLALYRRERAALLVEPPVIDELGPLATRLLDHLAKRGACFYTELVAAGAPAATRDVADALAALVWRGLVTNDTFQPLRTLQVTVARRGRGPARMIGGRFSRTADLLVDDKGPTARVLARTEALLAARGVVARESLAGSDIEGGFAALYPVLKELFEKGRVRRGHYVAGLGGAQFAAPGAVDMLRAARDAAPRAVVLAATDPANPWGLVLPWPERVDEGRGKGRRIAGARVVLVGGRLVLFIDGKSVSVFSTDDDELRAAVDALARVQDWRSLRVRRVDGKDAMESATTPRLLAAGFARDDRGLLLARDGRRD